MAQFGGSGAEGGRVTPADPFPVSYQEQQVLKDQHPRLQGWRGGPGLGETRPPKPRGIRSCWLSDLPQLVLPLTSSWGFLGIQAGTGGSAWPQTPRTSCRGSAGSGSCSLPLAEGSQAPINLLLVLIFMINIVFPLMVEISCALSLPQFTSLSASGVLPGSGEKKKTRCQNSYLKSPLGKRPQILSFLPKIDSKT